MGFSFLVAVAHLEPGADVVAVGSLVECFCGSVGNTRDGDGLGGKAERHTERAMETRCVQRGGDPREKGGRRGTCKEAAAGLRAILERQEGWLKITYPHSSPVWLLGVPGRK